MPKKPLITLAISSRALFDLEAGHAVYLAQGEEAYSAYQIAHEDQPLSPGMAYPLVKKLLALNSPEQTLVEVILLSRNSADTGLRIFNSIAHHGLDISRAAFTRGEAPYRYIQAFGAQLFLSAEATDVVKALEEGVAAATIWPGAQPTDGPPTLRIAFDGDSVLFSDAAERVYQESGLEAFAAHESASAHQPLAGGPFKPFLAALQQLQAQFPVASCPIRTALITARGAPAHERVIRTLRAWGIRIDEALFLGGYTKAAFLQAFGADIFFDDQRGHCQAAHELAIPIGHVPHGVVNQA